MWARRVAQEQRFDRHGGDNVDATIVVMHEDPAIDELDGAKAPFV